AARAGGRRGPRAHARDRGHHGAAGARRGRHRRGRDPRRQAGGGVAPGERRAGARHGRDRGHAVGAARRLQQRARAARDVMTPPAPALSLSEAERRRVEEVGRLTAAGAASVAPLMDMLADPSWTVRRAVVAGLGSLGEPAVRALCAYITTRRADEAALAAAVDALVASVGPADAAVAALAGSTAGG